MYDVYFEHEKWYKNNVYVLRSFDTKCDISDVYIHLSFVAVTEGNRKGALRT